MLLRRVMYRSIPAIAIASALSFVGVTSADAAGPVSGDTIPGAAAAVSPFTAGIPFSSGQGINVVVPANSIFVSNLGLNVVECTTLPGNLPPTDTASCDGLTINGNPLFPNNDGSVNFKTNTGTTYPIYALPDSHSLGEGPGGPTCSTTVACVLYIGQNQGDFTAPHVWSQPFYVQANADDGGENPGDGSPPPPFTTTTLAASPVGTTVDGQSVTLTATVTASQPATCTPSGSITFKSGTTTLGTGTIASGQAQLTTTAIPLGTDSLSAVFAGGSGCPASTSALLSYLITPASGDQIPSSTVTSGTVNPGIPFSSGQTINVVVPPNTVFNSTSGLNVVECSAPGLVIPTDPSACDGETINGSSLFANANGSVNFKNSTGSLYPIYALPDTISLGEPASGPACSTIVPCVLYIGENQGDFTAPHVWSNFFYVQPNADDQGEFPGDGSPPTTILTPAPTSSVFGQSVTLTDTLTTDVVGCTPSGSVTFKDGTTTLGTGPISAGSASLTTSAIPVGSNVLSANFPGSTGCPRATTGATPLTVSRATTTTAVTGAPVGSSVISQSVTFTATVAPVSPGAGSPTGTVTFKDGATTLGTPTVSAGVASVTTANLPPGPQTITASYNGDTDFATSTNSLSYNVNLASTRTELVGAPTSPSVFGQSVTFTATVGPVSPASTTPTGTVTFFSDGTNQIGTVQPVDTGDGGTASVTTSSLAVGTHSITATYSGDANDNGSSQTLLAYVVNQASTTTSVTSVLPASPSVSGQSVSFSATVTPVSPGAGTPTGSVSFAAGTTMLGSAPLAAGVATLSTTALPTGADSVVATYSGDSNFSISASGGQSYTVGQASTTTGLTPTPSSPSVFDQSVTFTATVTPNSPGGGTPSGSVTFMDGATTLQTVALSGGSASLSTSALAIGSHSITAVYGADTNFTASTSTAVTFVVDQASTVSVLTSSANPSAAGSSVTVTDTVAAVAPGSGTPTGTVTFMDGTTALGTPQTLSGGTARISTSTLSIGSHSITAVYGGDTNFTGSTSGALTQTVAPYRSTTALVSSSSPSKLNSGVTFTATVAGVAPAPGTPTGSVAFRDGSTLLGTSTLNGSGVATLTISSLGTGTHPITAVYGGDANFSTSTSASVAQVVQPAGGYWLVARDGGIFSFGSAQFSGSTGAIHLNQPIVGMAATPDGGGYWLVAKDGGIFTFGDAHFFGSVPQIAPTVDGIVGMVTDPATGGYWIINSDGTVFNFNAPQDGTLPFFGIHVNNIVGGATTPDGRGLYLVGSDGHVYDMLGSATNQGSLAGVHLNAPIISMSVDPSTGGYWLLGADGGVFSFNAPFFGSTGSLHLNKPVVGMTATSDGGGYWFVASDGGIFSFGDAVFQGSTGSLTLNQPVVGMASSG